jgi:hypothetical protein
VRLHQLGSQSGKSRRASIGAVLGASCILPGLDQDFFFGRDLKLRRQDYKVNFVGGFAASQLTTDYVVANGIHLPAKRRTYNRGLDR